VINTSDFLHLPYTPDLTEGGIAYALHSLPHTYYRAAGAPYERLRRVVAGTAVELAFRRYLSEQRIPFAVKGAAPFTEPDRYDVVLGGRRCDIQSFLIHHPDRLAQLAHDPKMLLRAPALVASDQHAGVGHSQNDIYLFAFLMGLTAASHGDLQKVIEAGEPHYLVHVMPVAWNRPSKWAPLGTLVLKSESEQAQLLEIGGQAEGRETRSLTLELPPRTRLELQNEFFSLSYIHSKSSPAGRIGLHAPLRNETCLIGSLDWGNIWVYGTELLLAGYMTREEFSRQASFVQAGAQVFQFEQTHVKNLAVPLSELKPLSELFERVKTWSSRTTTSS
jgi:hypothetical protein